MPRGRIRVDQETGPLLWKVVNDYITAQVHLRGMARDAGEPYGHYEKRIKNLKRIKGEVARACEEKGWSVPA